MSQRNLYALPTDGVQLRRKCGGNLTGTNESCVEFGEIPGTEGVFVVGDSKNPAAGQLRFTTEELDNFALGYIAERGLTA